MALKALIGGALAVALVFSATAVAANVPRAKLVHDADFICSYENGKRMAGGVSLPAFEDPRKATVKQLKASVPWFTRVHKLKKDEIKRLVALGTPSEAAAKVAWNRWIVLLKTVQLPGYAGVVAAAQRGDGKGFITAFAKVEKTSAEANKLVKKLGLKVCQWES